MTREEKKPRIAAFFMLEPFAQTAGEENIAPDLHRHGMPQRAD